MALMRRLSVLLLGVMLSGVVHAAEVYRLVDGSCPVKVRENSRWVSTDLPWSAGAEAEGSPVPESSSALQFEVDGRTYATPSRCWRALSSGTKAAKSSVSSWLGLGYLTWQETTALVRNDTGEELPLRANQSGWAVLYGREMRRVRNWRLRLVLGGFYTFSSVAPSRQDQDKFGSVSYQMTDAKSVGGLVVPEILWARSLKGASVGAAFPLMARYSNWVNTTSSGSTYIIQNVSRFQMGGWLVVKMQRPSLEVSSRLGLLGSTGNVAWMIDFSRSL